MSDLTNNLRILISELDALEASGHKLGKLATIKKSAIKVLHTIDPSANKANEKVFRYIYSSYSYQSIDQIKKICEKSTESNRKYGITGVLIWKNNNIIQLLEGDAEPVKSLASKIVDDTRHKNFKLLLAMKDCDRLFGEWGMGIYEPNNNQFFEEIIIKLKSINSLKYAINDLELGVKPAVISKQLSKKY